MPSFQMKVTKHAHLNIPKLTTQQAKQVGAFAISEIVDRANKKHLNIHDQGFVPYSPAPVYIPVTGKGRTKTSLGGVFVLTPSDLRKMKKKGVTIQDARKKKSPLKLGGIYRTKKSVRFPNRAAYKRSIGKSGLRDLEETGAMLGALTIVAASPTQIVLGWTREEEQKKASRNQRIDPWFGASPQNQSRIQKFANNLLNKNMKG